MGFDDATYQATIVLLGQHVDYNLAREKQKELPISFILKIESRNSKE